MAQRVAVEPAVSQQAVAQEVGLGLAAAVQLLLAHAVVREVLERVH